MAEILPFPTEAACHVLLDHSGDRFLLDEGLDLLADFRSIKDREVRAALRALVKFMAAQGKTGAVPRGVTTEIRPDR